MSRYNTKARKFIVDLDGVCFDFAGARDALGLTSAEYKHLPGAYRNLKLYPGVKEHLLTIIDRGFDVWIATKIPFSNHDAATEKLYAVEEHLPFLAKSVIITPNKGMLGSRKDFLLDDRPHKAHCDEFQGELLTYGPTNKYQNWDHVMAEMASRKPDGNIAYDVVIENFVVPIRCDTPDFEYVDYNDIPKVVEKELHSYLSSQVFFNTESGNALLAPIFERFVMEYNRK
jgi:hypothetical protein